MKARITPFGDIVLEPKNKKETNVLNMLYKNGCDLGVGDNGRPGLHILVKRHTNKNPNA